MFVLWPGILAGVPCSEKGKWVWRLEAGGWGLVAGGWWLVAGGW